MPYEGAPLPFKPPRLNGLSERPLACEFLIASVEMGAVPVELLLDGLSLCLTRGRDAAPAGTRRAA